MKQNNHGLTDTALSVLEKRYFRGEEDYAGMCRRVAYAVCGEDKRLAEAIQEAMYRRDFLPNSPALMNAGRELGQLSACYVLPVGDSMEEIFETMKRSALIFKSGGGVGYSFSRLRPIGSEVGSTKGVSSGPISFMKAFDASTETIKQGGTRRGASMGILRCDHPNIIDFIKCKAEEGILANFNLSVGITDEFMRAVEEGKPHYLVDPRNGEVVDKVDARELFELIVEHAWKNGEPGAVFLDTVNAHNPTPHIGEIEATNPCGEEPLLPYSSCNLASINLSNMVEDGEIEWPRLRNMVRDGVDFLDRVIDAQKYPIPEIEEMTKKLRPIGIGIMGLHDALIKLGVPYDSVQGIDIAEEIMEVIQSTAIEHSEMLGSAYSPYPAYDEKECNHALRRNSILTTIAPTGTLSMIADCSSGCEPYFAPAWIKEVLDGQKFPMVNKHLEAIAKKEGWHSEELMVEIADKGTVLGIESIPEKWQQVFKGAQDISPVTHIEMQAALQRHVCAAISKTINLPNSASKDDIATAYFQAWELGCKGLTVYRDGSRDVQVLSAGKKESKEEAAPQPVETPRLVERELLDVEEARRHRILWKGAKAYLIVSLDEDGRPIEVFIKLPKEAGINGSGTYESSIWQERQSNWDTVCRLTSQLLRVGMPLEKVLKQLEKSSYSMVDAPGCLLRVLRSYLPDPTENMVLDPEDREALGEKIAELGIGVKCPDCGNNTVVYIGGCKECKSPGCGYTACG